MIKKYEGYLGKFEYDSEMWEITKRDCTDKLKYIGNGKNIVIPKGLSSYTKLFEDVTVDVLCIKSAEGSENISDFRGMFRYCSALRIEGLENIRTDSLRCCTQMFYKMTNLGYLDLSFFNFSNCISCEEMFYGCSRLTKVNLISIKNNNCKNFIGMFTQCTDLEEIIGTIDISEAKTIGYMFSQCFSLKKFDLLNTGNQTIRLYETFLYCTSLESINFKNLGLTSVVLDRTFVGCTSLKSINLQGVKFELGFQSFYNCYRLRDIRGEGMVTLDEIESLKNYSIKCLDMVIL